LRTGAGAVYLQFLFAVGVGAIENDVHNIALNGDARVNPAFHPGQQNLWGEFGLSAPSIAGWDGALRRPRRVPAVQGRA
jgi:hypothetical protein